MSLLTFKTVVRNESQEWSVDGAKITSPENLASIRRVLEDSGPILVEHWFFYGGRSPARLVVDDYDQFVDYLKEKATAGDAIHVWDLHQLLRPESELAHGKCPADDGAVPRKGAY